MASGIVNVVRGKDSEFTIHLVDGNGRPVDLTGYTYAKLRLKKDGGGSVDKTSPLKGAVDEVQRITYSLTPSAGTFKLDIDGETSSAIPYNANTTDIENALNGLERISGVSVAGDFTIGHTITFGSGSGGRNISQMTVKESSLNNGVNNAVLVVTTVTQGLASHGIDVFDAKCGAIKVYLTEVDTVLLAKGKKLDMDLCVRVGARDLNIPIIKGLFNVEASPFE